MRKKLIEKIARNLKIRLKEEDRLPEIKNGYYLNWKKTLEPIFDKFEIAETNRCLYGNAAIQKLRENLKKNKEPDTEKREPHPELDMKKIKEGAEKAAKEDNLVDSALDGEITGEELDKFSENYRSLKIKKPPENFGFHLR